MSTIRRRIARSILASLLLVAIVAVPSSAKAPSCKGKRATIVGTAGADNLAGTKGRDVIVGLGGDDLIESTGGNDLVCGGPGRDELYGGPGNDVLVGAVAGDSLIGGPGNDQLIAGGGADYLTGNEGDDRIAGGGSGFDYADFRTSAAPVHVDLALGSATGDGDDLVLGIEMLSGTPLDDELLGSPGDFELYIGLDGDDLVDGRAGMDQIIYDESPVGVTVDLAAGTATGEGNDTLVSVESVQGSPHDDTLLGHDEEDDLYGNLGSDVIDGRGGNDYLLGGPGDDGVDGGAGVFDMIDFDPGAPAVVVDMATGVSTGEGNDQVSNFEIIGGSEFDDTLIGDNEDNLFYSYAGDDDIDGRGGSDLILYNIVSNPITADLATGVATGEGRDTFTAVEGFVGSDFADTLSGDANGNVLIGGPGDDELTGLDGDDYFDAGGGDDTIDGGPGTFDMLDFWAAPAGVTANLQTNTATGDGQDSLNGIEALLGSPFNDALSGDASTNFVFGSGGNDNLAGNAGDDGLDGGEGTDSLDGGLGTDDCVAGETNVGCEGGNQSPSTEEAERLQALQELLSQLFGGGGR
jgi:Ca2+-binding RTX toxin-like protein